MEKHCYQSDDLDDDEIYLFEKEWKVFTSHHLHDSAYSNIFEHHKSAIKEAACKSKYTIKRQFGGENPNTNEFGWMPILPRILMPAAVPTWRKEITEENVTFRWADWIGTPLLSGISAGDKSTMIIIGFVDPVAKPPIDAIRVQAHGVQYPAWSFGECMEACTRNAYMLSTPIHLTNRDRLYIQQLCGRPGISRLRPLGVHFTTSDNMRSIDKW